jgi:hypothetical protein
MSAYMRKYDIDIGGLGIDGIGRSERCIEKRAAEIELLGAMAVGEQAIVANAMEAVRQDVKQEAADEFAGAEPHDLEFVAAIVAAVVLPSEADVIGVKLDQAAVGDSQAMGIAGEIIEHLLGSAERSLGIATQGMARSGRRQPVNTAGLSKRARSPKNLSWPVSNAA